MPSYRGYRFPPEIISHAVWLYHRFSLSFRDVEDLLAERGITVTYETIRQWCLTFGIDYARRLRSRRGSVNLADASRVLGRVRPELRGHEAHVTAFHSANARVRSTR